MEWDFGTEVGYMKDECRETLVECISVRGGRSFYGDGGSRAAGVETFEGLWCRESPSTDFLQFQIFHGEDLSKTRRRFRRFLLCYSYDRRL